MNAAMAVATGQARHVLCFRTLSQYSEQHKSRNQKALPGPPGRVDGFDVLDPPIRRSVGRPPLALVAMRHMHEFGTTREQLGAVAVNGRRNAMRNPRALYRDRSRWRHICRRA